MQTATRTVPLGIAQKQSRLFRAPEQGDQNLHRARIDLPQCPIGRRERTRSLGDFFSENSEACSHGRRIFSSPPLEDQAFSVLALLTSQRLARGITKRRAVCVSEKRQTLLSTSPAAFPAAMTSASRI